MLGSRRGRPRSGVPAPSGPRLPAPVAGRRQAPRPQACRQVASLAMQPGTTPCRCLAGKLTPLLLPSDISFSSFSLVIISSSPQAQGDTDSEAARRRALAKLEGDDSQMQNSVKVHRGCAAPALNLGNAVGPSSDMRTDTVDCVGIFAGIRQAGGSAGQRRTAEGAALPCTATTVSLKALACLFCFSPTLSSIKIMSIMMCPQVAGLWGNAQGVIRAAAQSVTETVEEGVRDVSSLHAVKAASGCAALL
jgi:hypothetical protein